MFPKYFKNITYPSHQYYSILPWQLHLNLEDRIQRKNNQFFLLLVQHKKVLKFVNKQLIALQDIFIKRCVITPSYLVKRFLNGAFIAPDVSAPLTMF